MHGELCLKIHVFMIPSMHLLRNASRQRMERLKDSKYISDIFSLMISKTYRNWENVAIRRCCLALSNRDLSHSAKGYSMEADTGN